MKSATILVVDDEPQIRRVMRATLTAQGYTIVEARDGQEALEKLRSERPDLVLLDMNMPVMDGLEACREIRRDSEVPVIMLTVRSAEKDKVRSDIEYEVNIKAELEVAHLHEKTDRIYENMMARFEKMDKKTQS